MATEEEQEDLKLFLENWSGGDAPTPETPEEIPADDGPTNWEEASEQEKIIYWIKEQRRLIKNMDKGIEYKYITYEDCQTDLKILLKKYNKNIGKLDLHTKKELDLD